MKLFKTWVKRNNFRFILLPFILHTVIVFGSVFFLADFFPENRFEGFINPSLDHSSFFIKKLLTWDAHWFTFIAETGYTEKTTVFFPMLIIFIKTISWSGIEVGLSGFIFCNLFTYFSFLILYKLARLDFTEAESRRVLMAFSVFPTSFFLNTIYSESLFLFLALVCIYASQKNKYLLAGITGALATLSRNLGIVLFLVVGYEIWKDYRKNQKLDSSMFSILLIPIALLTFMLYNLLMFNDPIAFINNQQLWGRKFGMPLNNIWHGFVIFSWDLLNGFNPPYYGNNLSFILTSLSLFVMLLLSIPSRISLPRSYLIIGWLWLLIPLFSTAMPYQPLYSLSRFTLIIFPIFLFWGKINVPLLYYSYIGFSSLLLVLSVCLFVNGWWVG